MAAIEITNVQASAAQWVPGERAGITFTLKNVSGMLFTKMVLAVVLDERDFTGSTSGSSRLLYLGYALGSGPLAGETVNLAHNASRTFTVEFTADETVAAYFADYPSVRAVPLRLRYSAAEQSVGGNEELAGYRILNGYYTPLIADFSLERAVDAEPSDEGENVLLSARLAVAREDYAPFLQARLYYAQDGAADASSPCIDLTEQIPQLISGVTQDAVLVPGTYSNGSDWDFLLVFGDDYETAAVHCSLGRAFANLHLSGAKSGGACFGGFCSSVEGAPKLESYYPAHFYGGIQGVTNYVEGEQMTGGTWIDGKPIYRYVLFANTTIGYGQEYIGQLPGAVDTMIHCYGAMYSPDGYIRPLVFDAFGGTNYTAGFAVAPDNSILLQLGSGYYGIHRVVIVLEYTRGDAEE